MTHVSRAEMKAIKARIASKKAKRAENVAFIAAVGDLNGRTVKATGGRRPEKAKKRPNPRKAAFARLKSNRDAFVMLRGKHRTGGRCEVGMVCKGLGDIQVVYHVFPAAMGNVIKHDQRNLLAACHSCNGGEYFARKRGSDAYLRRHRSILGDALFEELKAAQGRQQIGTKDAIERADEYARMIERGDWRL